MSGRPVTSTESIYKDKKPDVQKRSRSTDNNEKEFENMINKSLPNWNAVWNFLLQNNNYNSNNNSERYKKKDKVTARTYVRPSKRYLERDNHQSLQKKIQNKIAELVKEEEALVKLYLKAADVAREREEELKDKTNVLMGQIEKDKNLMKIIQNSC